MEQNPRLYQIPLKTTKKKKKKTPALIFISNLATCMSHIRHGNFEKRQTLIMTIKKGPQCTRKGMI